MLGFFFQPLIKTCLRLWSHHQDSSSFSPCVVHDGSTSNDAIQKVLFHLLLESVGSHPGLFHCCFGLSSLTSSASVTKSQSPTRSPPPATLLLSLCQNKMNASCSPAAEPLSLVLSFVLSAPSLPLSRVCKTNYGKTHFQHQRVTC